MILGLIADTHNNDRRTRRALSLFEEAGVEAILHMGDLTSPEMVGLFAGYRTWIVEGNIDYGPDAIRAAAQVLDPPIDYAERHELKLDGLRIGLLHGDDATRLESMVASGAFDLVCHGHTHDFRDEVLGGDDGAGTRVVNPGALHRTETQSVCLYDTKAHPDEDALTRLTL